MQNEALQNDTIVVIQFQNHPANGAVAYFLTVVLRKGVATTPESFHRVSFQSWEVGERGGGGWCNPVILKFGYFENYLKQYAL